MFIAQHEAQVVVGLEVGPKLRTGVEIYAQTDGGIGCDAAALVHDFADARSGDMQVAGELVL